MSEQPQEKITLTWDELTSRKVEARLKEQDALARNREYAQMEEADVLDNGPARPPSLLARMWRNSVFALAWFGVVGGFLAWGLGMLVKHDPTGRQDADRRIAAIIKYHELRNDGRITDEQLTEAVGQMAGEGRENPYFGVLYAPVEATLVEKQLKVLGQQYSEGRITSAQASTRINALIETGRRENPFIEANAKKRDAVVAIYADDSLSDSAKERKRAEAESQEQATVAALEVDKQRQLNDLAGRDTTRKFIGHILEFGVAGVMIALFLAIALPVTEKNTTAVLINGSVGAALGLIGGVVVSFFFDKLYAAVLAFGPSTPARELIARVAAWGTLGLFLAIAPGLVMRNMKRLMIGLVGGLIGGAIGGLLYGPVAEWAGGQFTLRHLQIEKLVALLAIGLFAGLATGLIESVAKSGWVRVTAGLIAGKQFILYRNPTFVGSGPDCQIYLFKDPKVGRRHAALHIVPGGFEIEDLPLGAPTLINGKPVTRQRLRSGDRIQIGSTQLLFQEKTPAA